MFSKASKTVSNGASTSPATNAERPRAAVGVPSIISADLKIVGDMKSNGDIQVDGTIEGNIVSRSLTVGEGAFVQGSLVAENIRIYGAVSGEVKANTVMLARSAKVQGDVSHQSLSMEAGAVLEGQLSQLDKAVGSESKVATIKPEQDTAASAGDKSTPPAYGSSNNGSSGSTSGGAKPYGA